ncbi:MAG: Fe-S cluster assembly protein SufD [Gammaproteobacteria bacterium]|nr:Fe-S cluster assembly protein SufD [Gammaproteobacteria bacterium]
MDGSKSTPVQSDLHDNPQVQPYLDLHDRISGSLSGENLEWHSLWRHGCLQRFADQGFPTARDENWRYTPLRPVLSKQFTPTRELNAVPKITTKPIDGIGHSLVFVDGVFLKPDSADKIAPGIRVESISDVLNNQPDYLRSYLGKSSEDTAHAFSLLNNALYSDGVLIEIRSDVKSDVPLELLFITQTEAALILPRIVVISRAGSSARIIERHVGNPDCHSLTSGVGEMYIEKGAYLNYHLIESASDSAYQVLGNWAYLDADSKLDFHTTTIGGALVRNDLVIDLKEPGAECNLMGAYCLSGRQHVDNFTTVIHSAPHCNSNEHYKGVLDQRSRAVFHGRVRVAPDAQQSDAQQANNTLLLSADAEIDTKPQLEIYADDVKCSHGATVGNLNEQAMFYLKARGIDRDTARSMLIRAFVDEILDKTEVDPIQQHLKSLVDEKMLTFRKFQRSGVSS